MAKKGFTLIELLVVISIIGILSTLAVVSFNSGRGKARDARRVSDIKQISTLIETEAVGSFTGGYDVFPDDCDTENQVLNDVDCVIDDVSLTAFVDPSGSIVACEKGDSAPCAYSLGIAESATDYEICFYLEVGSGSVSAGLHSIGPGGLVANDCTYDTP